MIIDAWLPKGYQLKSGDVIQKTLQCGDDWQIVSLQENGLSLIVAKPLARRWATNGLVDDDYFIPFSFGSNDYSFLCCTHQHILAQVSDCRSPNTKTEALAFVQALIATRNIDKKSTLHDAIYVESISRLLPTYSNNELIPDDMLLGSWLTGGVHVSAKAFRRLSQSMSWLSLPHLTDIVDAAGFTPQELVLDEHHSAMNATVNRPSDRQLQERTAKSGPFVLAGRPALESFLHEHVLDIIENHARYKILGIEFPSAIVLHGPPGCGKTFAVERLVEHLGWPCYQIDSSSVASPYIHDTSRKIAEIFNQAKVNGPSVLVIDEMEAFLAERDTATGQHRVEEVAEFLRRIPEATKNKVLIIAMTNRLDMIDPAILRRGRFDHIIKVDLATDEEVKALLDFLLENLPTTSNVNTHALVQKLSGRSLADVSFIVREAARLAARKSQDAIDQNCLIDALDSAPLRGPQPARRIGFV